MIQSKRGFKYNLERGRKMASREARLRAQKKYDDAHRKDYFNFYVRLHKEKDKSIIDHLAKIENRTQYIKRLILNDMASGN